MRTLTRNSLFVLIYHRIHIWIATNEKVFDASCVMFRSYTSHSRVKNEATFPSPGSVDVQQGYFSAVELTPGVWVVCESCLRPRQGPTPRASSRIFHSTSSSSLFHPRLNHPPLLRIPRTLSQCLSRPSTSQHPPQFLADGHLADPTRKFQKVTNHPTNHAPDPRRSAPASSTWTASFSTPKTSTPS